MTAEEIHRQELFKIGYKDEVIEVIVKKYRTNNTYEFAESYHQAKLKSIPAEQSDLKGVMCWREITKEIPPEHENLLVRLDGDTYLMGIMDSNNEWGIYWSDGRNAEDHERPVTHWMPLPKAPSNIPTPKEQFCKCDYPLIRGVSKEYCGNCGLDVNKEGQIGQLTCPRCKSTNCLLPDKQNDAECNDCGFIWAG